MRKLNTASWITLLCALTFFSTQLPQPAHANPNVSAPGGLSGTVTNTVNTPLAGAFVQITGPTTASQTTDADGRFAFTLIPIGTYRVSISKSGFATATDDHVIVSGSSTAMTVVLEPAANASVKKLGRVVVTATSDAYNINVTPAAKTVVLAQVVQDQGQFQLSRILDQIPGVSTSLPYGYIFSGGGGFMTGAGKTFYASIRGGLSYQTAAMIDGHPIFSTDSVSVTGFNFGELNLLGLKELDVIKGPGALSPTINSAINGSVNYVTTTAGGPESGELTVGEDGYGGTDNHLMLRGTLSSKIGYALGWASLDTPGPMNGQTHYMSVFSGSSYYNIGGQLYLITPCNPYGPPGSGCTNFVPPGTPVCGPKPGLPCNPYLGTTLLECCVTQYSDYDSHTGFGKVRYNFSPTTSLSVMTLQTYDHTLPNLAVGGGYNTLFDPGPGWTGDRAAGTRYFELGTYGAPTWSRTHQVANEIELHTGWGRGLLRFSYLALHQYSFWGEDTPFMTTNTYPVTLWGQLNVTPVNPITGAPTGPPTSSFVNGLSATEVEPFNYKDTSSYSKYRGMTAEYDLPVGNNLYTIALDRTIVVPDFGYDAWGSQLFFGGFLLDFPAEYGGNTRETVDSALLRAGFRPARNLDAILSMYFNRYDNRASSTAANFSNPTPTQLSSFKDYVNYYDAPRLALTYRPTSDLSYRFAFGGSITPLPLNALNVASSPPMFNPGTNTYNESLPATTLRPETATGYDFGVDIRLPSQTVIVSTDTWLTNLRGMFFTSQVDLGTYKGFPLIGSRPANLGVARYYGAEATVRTTRAEGFNASASLALMRAYTYNLPANFYANLATGQQYAFNLAIIPYKNFYGGYYDGGAGNGVEAVPYSNGSASLSYTFVNKASLALNATYYGPNNSMYKPAFALLSATAIFPMAHTMDFQLTLDNIANIYPSLYQSLFDSSGVPVVLADGSVGLAPTSGIGPRKLLFFVTKHFGPGSE